MHAETRVTHTHVHRYAKCLVYDAVLMHTNVQYALANGSVPLHVYSSMPDILCVCEHMYMYGSSTCMQVLNEN